MITTEQTIEKLRKRYKELSEERYVRERLEMILGEWDGKKITRRFGIVIADAIEGYKISYYGEKGYERLAVRNSKVTYDIDLNRDFDNNTFNFDRFCTLNNSGRLIQEMLEITELLDNTYRIDSFLEIAETLNRIADEWKKYRRAYITLYSQISNDIEYAGKL